MGTNTGAQVVVIIVGFRNAGDVTACLRALAGAEPEPSFEIFVAENGGADAMKNLISALEATDWCAPASESELPLDPTQIKCVRSFRLLGCNEGPGTRANVAEMTSNLGYAGGVNAWLRPLLRVPGWEAAWILNPDTQVAPSALRELVAYSERRKKGMVGSRLIGTKHADRVHCRGLAWRKLVANTAAVDYLCPASPAPSPDLLEPRIDAPSGASCYVTRRLIEQIGLMDESYFLYFEDLDWGCRARAFGGVGYAHASIVPHEGGTTIGTAQSRANMSPLAVYLEFRNRILFVRRLYPGWLPWTVLMQLPHAAAFSCAGSFRNMIIALRGLLAGILGEVGRPDHILDTERPDRKGRMNLKRFAKILVSCLYLACLWLRRGFTRILGLQTIRPLIILYYHAVPGCKRAAFGRQMDTLARHAEVVPADWSDVTNNGPPAVAITFDDAFVSVAENALPTLAERGFPCTVFAPSGVLGRAPDWSMESTADSGEVVLDAERLRQIQGPLVTIGAHSISHPRLTRLSLERADAEISGSRDYLAQILGCPISLFAFPYGDYNTGIAALCSREGFKHAFTITPASVDVRKESLLRGRVAVDPEDGPLEFRLKVAGAYAWLRWVSSIKRLIQTVHSRVGRSVM